jgi:uncharacterized protein DUF4157
VTVLAVSAKAATNATPAQRHEVSTDRAGRSPSPVSTAKEGLIAPGQRIDPRAAARLSSAFAHDFSGVRVHTDERAGRSAAALGAAAYTHGGHIAFAPGRYAPGTAEGWGLLAHEAAHVVHQARSGPPLEGVAPGDAPSERAAQTASRRVSDPGGRAPADPLRSFRPLGRPWAVHLQRVTATGTKVFEEQRPGLAPGVAGPPVGTLEVRTGVTVEVSKGHVESNLISLEYREFAGAKTEWLQFVWMEMNAVTPKGAAHVAGSFPTTSGTHPFTTNPAAPSWAVDTAVAGNPFYASGGLAIRNSGVLTMFDRPGGASAGPLATAVFGAGLGATSVTFTAHFDSYLLRNDKPMYHVPWAASTAFTQAKGSLVTGPVTYAVGTPGNVTALDATQRGVLQAAFPAYKHIP